MYDEKARHKEETKKFGKDKLTCKDGVTDLLQFLDGELSIRAADPEVCKTDMHRNYEKLANIRQPAKDYCNTPRKAQVEVGKNDVHRDYGKFANIWAFSVKEQNCHIKSKNICELEMKTRPKKAKKYNYSKHYKEQIRDQHEKKSIQMLCDTQERLVCMHEPVEHCKAQVEVCKNDVHGDYEKSANVFPFPVKKKSCQFEPKKIGECEMKTRPKKTKKYSHIKGCEEQSRETGGDQDRRPDTNRVVKQPIQNCYNIPRETQVEVYKTYAHRYYEKSSNILPFPVKKKNCQFKPRKVCGFEMKTRPKKTKKHRYIKEQPREICDQGDIQPLCNTQERMVRTYEPTENGSWNQYWTNVRPKVCKTDAHRNCEKFSNSFTLPAKEQIYRFEPKKIYELEMKTHPKKTKKYSYIKDCKEQPREIRDQGDIQPLCDTQERMVRTHEINSFTLPAKDAGSWNQCWTVRPKERNREKFSNSFTLLAKEQIYRFEPKTIYELEMKTRPKKTKKDSYIKDCKEQPREICDQCDIQPLCDTQERMVRIYETNRK